MKIRISFTVDVDEEAWGDEYCLFPKEVRDDVKSLVISSLLECPAGNAIRSIKEH